MKIKSNELEAGAVIFGTVVGLGIFAIPYATKNTGVLPGIFLIALVAVFMVFISLLFAEIIFFSGKEKGLIFYAERYLGAWSKKIITGSIFFGYMGALLAYVLATEVFFRSLSGLSRDFFWPIILFFTSINALVLIRGVKSLGRLEIFFSFFMLIVFLIIFFKGLNFYRPADFNWANFFIPYGVVWFALSGESAIPVVVKLLKKEKEKVKPVIIFSYGLVFLITAGFLLTVLSVSGSGIKTDPFLSLGQTMGSWVIFAGSVLSLMAVATSFWVSATFLKKTFITDLRISPLAGWFLVIFGPLALIALGVHNFIKVIGLVGILMGTINSLIIMAIYNKIFFRKNVKPKILSFKIPVTVLWLAVVFLILAALSSLYSFIKFGL